MYRFLFVIPENIEKPYWGMEDIDESISDNWTTILGKLLQLPSKEDENKTPEPIILKFTPKAKEFLFDWQRINTDKVRKYNSDVISGIYCKMETYCSRLALILELLYYACDESDKETVGIKSIDGAIKLAEYFKKTAAKVSQIVSNKTPLEKLTSNKLQIFDALLDTFATQEGLNIAKLFGLNSRTFERFLAEKTYFLHTSQGEYKKQIFN